MAVQQMPASMFIEVFGTYVPRLCVDTAVIGPNDLLDEKLLDFGLRPRFEFKSADPKGVVLKERDERPRLGQWGLPGGTMRKGETPLDASERIIRSELGIEIDPIGVIGIMHFPNEEREMEVEGKMVPFTIDSLSVVILARACSADIHSKKGKNIGWFLNPPPVKHEIHTPFLQARGLLRYE